MDRYKIIKEVGDGTFGIVWQALNKRSGEVVAIKKMKRKYYSWEECINLREVKDCSLYHLMKDKGNPFSEIEIRNWCFQVFQGLVYMHQHGYFHRDLKPENLLVSKGLIKIADFGLACEITSQPPYTEYVSTRWYRAPEVLLQSPKYGSEVDLWAMGAIMAELFTLRPLFPGSSEADEIYKICSVIGSPTKSTWCVGLELSSKINYQFPEHAGVDLAALLPSASKEAVNLIAALCSWDPCKRPTAVEALQHPFFQNCYNYIPPSLRLKPATSKMSPSAGLNDSRRAMNQKYAMGYSGVLPHVKPAGNITSSVKLPASLNTGGGHHKLEMNHQGGAKYGERQPKYQPAVKCNTTGKGKGEGVWDTAGKLAHMNIGSAGRPPNRNQHVYIPPPAKAKQRKPCDGSRPYCSKVAG